MTRSFRLLALVVGAVILLVLVNQVGVGTLVDGARQVGWLAIPIFALHALVYWLNAVAWWLSIAHLPGCPPLRTLYRVTVGGFAINFLTPVVNAGGEPYRIAALTPWLGGKRAGGAVLQYVMLHTLSSLVIWLAALLLALTLPGVSPAIRGGLVAAALIVVLALQVVRSGHRGGFVASVAGWIARRRLGRLSAWVAEREAGFKAADDQMTAMHRERPGRLAVAVGVDCLSRVVAAGEILLVGYGMGQAMSLTAGFVVSGLSALTVNIFFLLPWELGSREGSLYLLFGMAGMPVAVGLIAAVLTRGRELVWAAIGLILAGQQARRS
jgi:uncharacterized protein (TIRG00374 family)